MDRSMDLRKNIALCMHSYAQHAALHLDEEPYIMAAILLQI